MPEYLLTAKQPDGQVVTECVSAASGDAAVALLRQRGCSEIVLHTDDASAVSVNYQENADSGITPRDYVALRTIVGFFGFVFFLLVKLYKSGWKLNLAAVVVLLVRRSYGYPLNYLDWLCLAWLAFPLVLALAISLFGRSQQYMGLIESVSWGRWHDVLRRLPALQKHLPAHEFAVRKAQALAGIGCIEEGLRELAPFAHDEQVPEWMYWARLADVFTVARDRESALAAVEKAAELAPENAVVLMDLANMLLIYRQDTGRARVLLDRARAHELSDMLIPLMAMCEGILAFEEGRAQDAIGRLEDALAGLKPFRNASPLMGTVVAKIHAYLALAHAARLDKETANRYFRLAEPRMKALRQVELLTRCQKALGLPVEPIAYPPDSDNPYQSPVTDGSP